MENKHLIDLSVKYGLNSEDVSKLVSVMYQIGVDDMDSAEFKRVAGYICGAKLIEMPVEELIEELRRKGMIKS
ncbi:hypothetical protein HZA40_01215 [Candidatus Peregrinibacteria bacterium]|nr:hypothetical protein [Candidatus Peregrinibacteria bacterium]